MKLKQSPLVLLLVLFVTISFAQSKNPFQSIGKKGKILTLTKGQYEELFDQNSIQQIGSCLIDLNTMKVVKLLTDKESTQRIEGEKHSRFLSVDPLARSYPMLTPYQYASNGPIAMIDIDGLEGFVSISGTQMPVGRQNIQFDVNGDLIPDYNQAFFGAASASLAGGLAIVTDMFVTRGKAMQFVMTSQLLGTLFHNKAASPQEEANRNQAFKAAAADASIGLGMSYMLGLGLNTSKTVYNTFKNRVAFAKSFKGFKEEYLPYADFNEKVSTRIYRKGEILYQYQKKDGSAGNFFVESTTTTPEQVGLLSKDYSKILKVELKEDVEVLVTKHSQNKEYWGDGKTKTSGGGEQLFSTEIKNANKSIITEVTK